MSDKTYKISKTSIILIFFAFAFFTCIFLIVHDAPDEAMRYALTQWIYSNNALPTGTEPELIHEIWGFSYALYPYASSLISVFFMKIVSLFTWNSSILLIAARMTSVLSGTVFVILCFKIGEMVFKRRGSIILFAILCGFLPQFVFLCSYHNNDSFALFTIALIIYFWLKGMKYGWGTSSCVGIGISCGICALSYYNAYGYILLSIPLVIISMAWQKIGFVGILKKCGIILLIAFLICGWFFVRNAVLHEGDFLGRETIAELGEEYAQDGFKPSQHDTPSKRGYSFFRTFFACDPGDGSDDPFDDWIINTTYSFIGVFSFLTVYMSPKIYYAYILFFLIGLLMFYILALRKKYWNTKEGRLMVFIYNLAIIIPIGLSMYNSYYSDFQAQGRYIMPALIPLMLMITEGYDSLIIRLNQLKRKSANAEIAVQTENTNYCKVGNIFLWLCLLAYMGLFLISYFKYLTTCLSIFV